MNKHIFFAFLMAAGGSYFAQVRIGVSNANAIAANSSAFIDASSNTTYNGSANVGKGLLYPRVNLAAFTAFGGTPTGIPTSYPNFYDGFVVYNTATSGAVGVGTTEGSLTAGFWYYENKSGTLNGGTWKPLKGASANYVANNGLTMSGTNIKLGGALTEPTTISGLTATNKLAITGTGVNAVNIANNTVSIDAQNNRVGIGTNDPLGELTVKQSGDNKESLYLLSSSNNNKVFTAGSWAGGTGFLRLYNSANANATPPIQLSADPNSGSQSYIMGALGIGTSAPSAKLEINNGTSAGAVKIVDGTQAAGKVLTSDANGLASWQIPSAGATYTGSASVSLNAGSFQRAALTGDVTAGLDSNATTVVGIQGKPISITSPTTGQVLKYDGTNWSPSADNNTIVTGDNGLTKTADNIQLGGALTKATTISGVSATNKLVITGTGVDAVNIGNNTLSIDATNKRVGIGTAAPIASLEVRGAVRAGVINTGESIGENSIALGDMSIATGLNSFSAGRNTIARGTASIAIGAEVSASGLIAIALGSASSASGTGSIVIGGASSAEGPHSIAIGSNATTKGGYSYALGNNATASGSQSFAFGSGTVAPTVFSTVMGKQNLIRTGSPDLPMISTDPLFQLGNGTTLSSNAITVQNDGKISLGTHTVVPVFGAETLLVNGSIKTAGNTYADYVFEDYFEGNSILKSDYKFKNLYETEAFIKQNRHLPGVTPIKDLEKTKDGGYAFNITDLSVQSLEKIEELYLHTIEQQKLIDAQQAQIDALLKVTSQLQAEMKNLK